ncbi:PQQ-binding-like beta-propeller repeat protein [Streptomyces sp. NPDC006283]|uniref:outer membrane protein assembly factor BamB family protein n=1 Tax=Streptomyces sp. NPDC006283 TaxID=3156741 RepID=UPI0033A2DE5D
MEPLQQDDPERIGPYRTLARLGESASCVRFLAAGPDDEDAGPVVVALARPELSKLAAFRRRFHAEAGTAELLAGGWVQAPVDSRTDGEQLWTAAPYVPALALREAIALAGPLPERAVRTLGAALAETLSRVHATGTVLQGLAPDTVLLTADGPRLTAFGALGAAAVAEAGHGGQLSVQLGYLTPEQVLGTEPGTASDIFVLGLLLAYAATGTTPLADAARIAHAEPDLAGVPEALRPLVAQCLAKSPEDRPRAGMVAADLALEGAAALARDGWLPEALLTSLTKQATQAAALRDAGRAEVGDTTTLLVRRTPLPAAAPLALPAQVTPGVQPPAGDPVGGGPAPAGQATPAPLALPGQVTSGVQPPVGVPPVWPGGGGGDRTSHGHLGAPALGATPIAGALPPGPASGMHAGAGFTAPPDPAASGTPGLDALPPGPASGMYAGAGVTAPPGLAGPGAPGAALPGGSPGQGTSRRGLLVAGVAALAGIGIGGGIGYALAGSGKKQETGAPAPGPKPSRMTGLAPDPAWRYEHPADGRGPVNAVVWQDRLLLVTDSTRTTGVDLRTGRRRWATEGAASALTAVPVDDRLCLVVGPGELLWIAAGDGSIVHRVPHKTLARPGETLTVGGTAGADGSTVWLVGHVTKSVERTVKKRKQKVTVKETYLVAFDLTTREQLWRARVPDGRAPYTPGYHLVAARPDSVLVRQEGSTLTPAQRKTAKNGSVLLAFDRRTGTSLASVPLTAVAANAIVTGDGRTGKVFAAAGGELHAYDSSGGKRLWRLPAAKTIGEAGVHPYGTAALHGPNLYIANRYQQVSAVDTATGRQLWRRWTEAPTWRQTPRTVLSGSGRTVLAGDAAQLTAFAARDGRRLWKFQEAGSVDAKEQAAPRYTVLAGGDGLAVVQRGRTFYALPVD